MNQKLSALTNSQSTLISRTISRRTALGSLVAGAFGAACGSEALNGESPELTQTDAAPAATSSDVQPDAGVTQTLKAWAIGGTAAMLAAASYPNPFASGEAECALTCMLTLGPCWAPTAPLRQDVSEGEPGIPMRLMLRVVDENCEPLEGVEVEIWHGDVAGHYSADNVEGGAFCTGGDEHAIESYFFRGRAIADADGIVTFDGCFPGWYSGRAVHIHFLVRMPEEAGAADSSSASVISQLFFPEELTASIFGNVEGYKDRGQPDTSLAKDNVLSAASDVTPYMAHFAQMSDGAMLAWKTVKLSKTEQCGSAGGGGMGGAPSGGPMGGPPPGGSGFPMLGQPPTAATS